MSLHRITRALNGTILLLLTLSIVLFLLLALITSKRQQAHIDRNGAVEALTSIRESHDALRHAIHAYAATGDIRYRNQFQTELMLDGLHQRGFERLRAMSLTDAELRSLDKVHAQLNEQMALAARVIEAAQDRDLAQARALVFAEDFLASQAALKDSLDGLRDHIVERLAERAALYSLLTQGGGLLFLLLSFAELILVWVVLRRFFERRLIQPLADLTRDAERMVAGDLTQAVDHQQDKMEIGRMARAMESYRRVGLDMEQQRWVKTTLAELSTRLQDVETLDAFIGRLCEYLLPVLGSGAAALYLREPAGSEFSFCGGWGVDSEWFAGRSFVAGQGLLGQAARGGQAMVLREVPPDYPRLRSGLGEGLPSTLVLAPLKVDAETMGVLEFALFKPPSARKWALLSEMYPLLAPRLALLQRSLRTQDLLESTQSQSRQLQAQTAQLAQLAQELEAQRSQLQASAEALAQSNREQKAIFESASMGIALLRNRVILSCNPGLDRLFGYAPGEQLGQTTRLWYPDDAGFEAGGEAVYAVIARGETSHREQQLKRKDGSLFWCRLSGSAVDPGDLSRGVVWLLEDVTPAHEAAQALRDARHAAEQVAQIKSDFLANMSHEIRTPMNAILGMNHLLLKTELTPRQRDYLRKAQSAGQHLLSLINDILDLSKIEAGGMTLEHGEFQLSQLRDRLIDLVGERASEKGVKLVFDLAPDIPPSLVGDSLRLGQVLINFTNNALKFTDHGQVSVRASVEERRQDQVVLRFEVRDTGIGMTEVQLDRLFQNFQQADASITRKYGGTGLGLAISRRLVTLLGGEVGVQSQAGQGSNFWFTVPLGIGRATGDAPLALPARLKAQRALVVDDRISARMVLCDRLMGMGLQVSEAASGASAVEAVRRAAIDGQPYALVFLDWRMPEMDGFEAARAIQALGLEPAPHLVIVTAYGWEEVMQQVRAAGLDDVLIKPVDPSLLHKVVLRVLDAEEPDEASRIDYGESGLERRMARVRGARILLVDDNALNQQVAGELLRQAGLVVDIAGNGQSALDGLESASYDLVLMDMQMPVMDGLAATRRIRANPAWQALPVIAMTANAMAHEREACAAAGMNDFVAKPIEPDRLWAVLLRWLEPKAPAFTPTPRVSEVPASAPTPPSLAGLPDIPGLDLRLGLRRALGRRDLYASLLERFVTGQTLALQELGAELHAADKGLARRLAHTCRGVAGQIGATEVEAAAAALEQSLRVDADPATLDQRYAALHAPLNALLEALRPWLATSHVTRSGQAPTPSMDTDSLAAGDAQWQDLQSRLAELLASGDARVRDEIEAHAPLLRAAWGPAFDTLKEHIDHFDFEAALRVLKAQPTGQKHHHVHE